MTSTSVVKVLIAVHAADTNNHAVVYQFFFIFRALYTYTKD